MNTKTDNISVKILRGSLKTVECTISLKLFITNVQESLKNISDLILILSKRVESNSVEASLKDQPKTIKRKLFRKKLKKTDFQPHSYFI